MNNEGIIVSKVAVEHANWFLKNQEKGFGGKDQCAYGVRRCLQILGLLEHEGGGQGDRDCCDPKSDTRGGQGI